MSQTYMRSSQLGRSGENIIPHGGKDGGASEESVTNSSREAFPEGNLLPFSGCPQLSLRNPFPTLNTSGSHGADLTPH